MEGGRNGGREEGRGGKEEWREGGKEGRDRGREGRRPMIYISIVPGTREKKLVYAAPS